MSDRSSVGVDPACHRADPAMENVLVETEVPRTKAQSFNTVNTLFHESCREVGVLTHQMRQKDCLIADLRARLAKYEGASMRQDGEEPVVFGPSKSLIDTLFEEISMLKQKLKDTERQAAQQSETSKLVSKICILLPLYLEFITFYRRKYTAGRFIIIYYCI